MQRSTHIYKNGIFLAVLASLLFSLMNLSVKMVADDIPVSEIVFFRSLFGLVAVLLIIKRRRTSLRGKRPWLLVLRGLLGATAIWGGFLTISKIKLGDAAILANTSPLFVVLFAAYFLGERLSRKNLLLLAAALVGALLVIKPAAMTTYTLYTWVGLGTAVVSAGASVSIRALTKDTSTHLIIFYFMGITCLATLPPTVAQFVWPTPVDWLWLLLVGLSSLIAQFVLTQAYRYAPAGNVSTARLSSVVWNIFWGVLIWHEFLDLFSLLGGGLIIASCHLLYRQNNGKQL